MGEKISEQKPNIENGLQHCLQDGLIEPLISATGKYLLRRLPEKNAHLDEVEHSYLGFWGTNSVVNAFKDIPQLTSTPNESLIICDMDGPFIKLRPSIFPELKVFDIDKKQVDALENSHTPNLFASNRSWFFPETGRLLSEMEGLGVNRDKIYLSQDKEYGTFRNKNEFSRLVETVKEISPKQLFLIFDMYNWPVTLMQDITGTSGNYLKDILHNMDLDKQKEMAVGMVGVTPLLKDTIFVPFDIMKS
jgi:hypothetical protein